MVSIVVGSIRARGDGAMFRSARRIEHSSAASWFIIADLPCNVQMRLRVHIAVGKSADRIRCDSRNHGYALAMTGIILIRRNDRRKTVDN